MKKQSSLSKTTPIPEADTKPFGQTFIIKGESLSPGILPDDIKATVKPFKSQQELKKLVLTNRAVLFGEQTIGLVPKDQPSSPWDAILFTFSDPMNPQCYLIKTVAASYLFLVFVSSMTNMFGSLRNAEYRRELMDSISRGMSKDKRLQKNIEKFFSKGMSITSLLEQTFLRKPQVLVLTDDIHLISPGFIAAYPETWRDMLRTIYVQKYQAGKQTILTMNPPLADLKEKRKEEQPPKEKVIHTEDHHFAKGALIARTIYERLKSAAIGIDKSVVFNAKGKHYISLKRGSGKNLAFFHFRKGGMYLVVMLEEKLVRKMVKHSEIKTLPESVQKFWNGKSTGLMISSTQHLKEIVELLRKLIKG